jgi:hypothetical protein
VTEKDLPYRLSVEIRTPWPTKVTAPVLSANRFALQVSPPGEPTEILLTVGHLSQPLLSGSPEEQRVQAEALTTLEIAVLGRYSVQREKLRELYEVLGKVLEALPATGQSPKEASL